MPASPHVFRTQPIDLDIAAVNMQESGLYPTVTILDHVSSQANPPFESPILTNQQEHTTSQGAFASGSQGLDQTDPQPTYDRHTVNLGIFAKQAREKVREKVLAAKQSMAKMALTATDKQLEQEAGQIQNKYDNASGDDQPKSETDVIVSDPVAKPILPSSFSYKRFFKAKVHSEESLDNQVCPGKYEEIPEAHKQGANVDVSSEKPHIFRWHTLFRSKT